MMRPTGHHLALWLAGAALALASVLPVRAETAVETAILKTHADIEASTTELIELRAKVATEKKPLVEKLRGLERKLGKLRAEVERRSRVATQTRMEQEAVDSSLAARRDELTYLQALLTEYRRSAATRVHPAELPMVETRFEPIDELLSDQPGPTELGKAASQLLEFASSQSSMGPGGHVVPGQALDASGRAHDGNFAIFGPMAYFAPKADGPAGLVALRPGALRPTVLESVAPLEADAARALVQGSEVVGPVDVSSGDSLRAGAARRSLVEHLRAGGVVVYPLLLLAVLAVILVLAKIAQLSRINVRTGISEPVLARLRAGDETGALAAADSIGEPLAALLRDGIAHRDAPKEHLEEIMHERILAGMPLLEKHLGTLAVFGGIAPLLGLLGTVTGMIHTFQLVTIFGTGEAKLLSGGISEALVTTEVGLVVAIPVLLAHAVLARRVRTVVAGLETVAVEFVNGLASKGGA